METNQKGIDFMDKYNTEEEIWKDVVGFEGSYQVSNFGNVRSLDRLNSRGQRIKGVTLRPQDNTKGYKYVTLFKGSRTDKENMYIHRLVASAFLEGNEETVNHKDGNKSNNHVDNLEWATRSENTQHAYDNGLMKRAIRVKVMHECGEKKVFNNSADASIHFGYNRNWIRDRVARHGNTFSYDGKLIKVI